MTIFEVLILIFLISIIIDIGVMFRLYKTINRFIELDREKKQPKQFKREHVNVSKTNFRKYFKWTNRCIC